jgi:diaminopimelate epimerase
VIDAPSGRLGAHEFVKYTALGNTYLIVDATAEGVPSAAAVQRLCDVRCGVGADGVLVVLAPSDPRGGCQARLRIFNPDGSEAEKSGNGLRIFARALYDLGYTREAQLRIELQDAPIEARLLDARGETLAPGSPAHQLESIEVAMGRATLTSTAVGMAGPERSTLHEPIEVLGETLHVVALSVGNPHCVLFDAAPSVARLRIIGPALERHPAFVRRTNVQLARVVAPDRIEMLIWERGAGETSASGSSSCAVVAAAYALGRVGRDVTVQMPGGTLSVHIGEDGVLHLRGPAQGICRGQLMAAAA